MASKTGCVLAFLLLAWTGCSTSTGAGTTSGGSSSGSSTSGGTTGAASTSGGSSGSGSSGSGSTSGGSGGTSGTGSSGSTGGTGGSDGGCSTGTIAALPVRTALVLALDRSSSMVDNGKWIAVAQGLVDTLDQDVFDALDIGLVGAPSGDVTGPNCVVNLPVACGVPLLLQVPVQAAGTSKSSAATGPRRAIKNWLTANSPGTGSGDSLPLYDLVTLALAAAGSASETGERLVLLVSDGSPGCGQLASRPGFSDCNGCDHEWENPLNIITLVGNAEMSPQQPVDTFLVGAPGADTTGANCNSPPYSMRAAFSAIAYSGAPTYAPTTCTGRTWTMSDPDPAIPCHSDQTTGGFSSTSVGDALAAARAAVVGCRFQLPTGPGGTPLNPSEVNVQYRVGAAATVAIPKRSGPGTDCSVQGCWDYVGTSEIGFYGHACQDAKGAQSIEVEVLTGCPTEVI